MTLVNHRNRLRKQIFTQKSFAKIKVSNKKAKKAKKGIQR